MQKSIGIGHLLVVAGVAGAGKSTFIDQVISRSLPTELGDKLSADNCGWKELNSRQYELWLPVMTDVVAQTRVQNMVLHHSIFGSFSLKDSLDDEFHYKMPNLISVIPHTDIITIVTIRPPNTQIIDQLVHREGAGLSREELNHRSLLSTTTSFFKNKFMRRAIKTLGTISLKLDLNLKQAKRRTRLCHKLRVYEKSGWIEGAYDRWQSQLASVMAEAAPIEHIVIEYIVIKPEVSLHDSSNSWLVVKADKNT